MTEQTPGQWKWAMARIDELERWQEVDLANYKRHLAELEEMLTAVTDTAVQRGKRIDELTEQLRLANIDAFNLAAEVADGG